MESSRRSFLKKSGISLGAVALFDRKGLGSPPVTLVPLPEIGIRGNTHFPFSDLNHLEIAGVMSNFLEEMGLDCPLSLS